MSTIIEARLGLDGVTDSRAELRPNWSAEDLAIIIRAAYQQVFGRQGVYADGQLTSAESLLRNGQINVRQFIRTLAKSDLYKERFFSSNSQVRFIELNYKHLLGRAPYDQSEIQFHVDLYAASGYDADIDSYIDSPEYDSAFGNYTVPYYRGLKSHPGMQMVGYTRLFEIYRGQGNSDNAQVGGKDSRLQKKVAMNLSNAIREPSSALKPSVEFKAEKALCGTSLEPGRVYRIEAILGGGAPGTQVRRSKQSYTVPYDRFSSTYQEIHRRGGKITSIVPV
jgi:phycoerythrocyanin-associated rod linker protein